MSYATRRRLWWRHLLSVLVFPVTMTVVIPGAIALLGGAGAPDFGSTLGVVLAVTGGLLIVLGLWMLVWTVVLFDREGEGTLGVGDVMGQPVKLVVRGPYRHVRNPMMTGVFGIQLGTAVATASPWLLGWFVLYCTVMAITIRRWEEPHLSKRFGIDYETYRRNVPRWVPRPTAWEASR